MFAGEKLYAIIPRIVSLRLHVIIDYLKILTGCRENLRNSGSDQHEPSNRNAIQQCCPRAYRCQASDERAKHQRRKRHARRPDAFEDGEFLEVRLLPWNRGSGRRVFPCLFSHLDLALLNRLLVFALAPA